MRIATGVSHCSFLTQSGSLYIVSSPCDGTYQLLLSLCFIRLASFVFVCVSFFPCYGWCCYFVTDFLRSFVRSFAGPGVDHFQPAALSLPDTVVDVSAGNSDTTVLLRNGQIYKLSIDNINGTVGARLLLDARPGFKYFNIRLLGNEVTADNEK